MINSFCNRNRAITNAASPAPLVTESAPHGSITFDDGRGRHG